MTENPGSSAVIDGEAFEALRPYLFAIAYRLLGAAGDAEDIVQDSWLRMRRTDEVIRSPKAYMATVVTRLCLNHLTAARTQRETYPGPWLPEPAPTVDIAITSEPDASGIAAVERGEEVSMAVLVLLERLSPEERAVFVLREAFAYPYAEIASVIGKSVAATRQLSHRAREHVAAGRTRFTATTEQQHRLATRFLEASRRGDLETLTEVLAADATAWVDGGASRPQASRHPIHGAYAVATWMVAVMAGGFPCVRVSVADINGGGALLLWDRNTLVAAATFDIDSVAEQIVALRLVANPEKLAYLQRRLSAPGADRF
jgi:RNA polymerase sigma-70 factor (ECF subfamily)